MIESPDRNRGFVHLSVRLPPHANAYVGAIVIAATRAAQAALHQQLAVNGEPVVIQAHGAADPEACPQAVLAGR